MMFSLRHAVFVAMGTLVCGIAAAATACGTIEPLGAPLHDWPAIRRQAAKDPVLEARIASIVAGMSLREKIGQMTQAEIQSITPEEVRRYYIGSVLNGGGSWPDANRQAGVSDWMRMADAFQEASMQTDSKVKVPILWGTDAVHGHNNVYGATLFPHNIGLGAAHDPCLVQRIAEATARQARLTGQDWIFAPTLAVARDDRWGRTYESFSENPAIVRAYGRAAVLGLQGKPANGRIPGVIATAKHFIADGGTDEGRDQGVATATASELVNIHAQGYYSALAAGVQTVMVSFSSWRNPATGEQVKLSASKYLITDVLKGKLGFDGFTISDWNAIGQVPGCTPFRCAEAINAGVDMFMVPTDWKRFIESTVEQVERGEVPMSRIDDAVTRILRVKFRAGLFDAPRPSQRAGAAAQEQLQQRELAREAVRKSLVLLKNDRAVVPLRRGQKILVVGRSADHLPSQTGGWSLTWQGSDTNNEDFPQGVSILRAIRETAGAGLVDYSESAEGIDLRGYGAVIAVIGETPYAEMQGDLHSKTLAHAQRFPEDLALLKRVSGQGVPVVTVLLSGRPEYVNPELNRSDAFVAAWLPGTEGTGVADMLFRTADGRVQYEFNGRLAFSWPAAPCQTPLNVGDRDYKPMFAYGYGLKTGDRRPLGRLAEPPVPSNCANPATEAGTAAAAPLDLFAHGRLAKDYGLLIGSSSNWSKLMSPGPKTGKTDDGNLELRVVDVDVQGDGRRAAWRGGPASVLVGSRKSKDLRSLLKARGALVFDAVVEQAPKGSVTVQMLCNWPCRGEVEAGKIFRDMPTGTKRTLKFPLACFAAKGAEMGRIDVPFTVFSTDAFELSFANVRLVPGAADDSDALRCEQLSI